MDLLQRRKRAEDHISIVLTQLGNEDFWNAIVGEEFSLSVDFTVFTNIIGRGEGIQLRYKIDGLTHKSGIRVTQELEEVVT